MDKYNIKSIVQHAAIDKSLAEVSAINFSLFRLFFGLLMIPQVINLVPHIHDLATSTYVFHYPYLWFIEAWSHELIDVLQYISLAAAILLAFGIHGSASRSPH